MEDDPNMLTPTTRVVDPDEFLGSHVWAGAATAIWERETTNGKFPFYCLSLYL